MKVKLLTLSVLLISQFGYSQTKTIDQSNTRDGESVEYCLQHKKTAELIASDPAVAKTLANDELIRQQEELAASQGFQPKATTWYVPIVFHVLHNGGSENVSDEQIQDALNIVNRDYARLNADADNVHVDFQGMPTAADVVFVLATKAPDGTCFSGITRTQNALSNDGSSGTAQVNAIVNGNDVYQGTWPGNKYCNVFVCGEIGGAAGYTYTPSNWLGSAMGNGIWILDTYLGSIGTSSTSSSRTLTHETGHWLNLSHVWGPNNNPGNASSCGDDDQVTDTPNEIGVTSCNLNEASCGPRANVENYMDYSYCSKMFTQGQVTRMRNALSSSVGGRSNLRTTANLIATGADGNTYLCKADFSADRSSICAGNTIQFSDESYNEVSGWTWTFNGGTPNSSTDQNPLISYDTPGLYEVTLEATDGTITDSEVKTSYIRVLANAISLPVYEGFESYTTLDNLQEWGVVNENNDAQFLLSTTVGLSGTKSVVLPNYGQTIGSMDELISQPVDLSVLDPLTDNMTLSFRYAYKRRNTSDDDWLRVYLTSNCGDTWAIRKTLHGVQLGSNTQTNSFTPTSAADWRTIHMTNVTSPFWVDNFRYKFAFEAGGGNNIYIDDINIYQGSPSDDIVDGIAGINELNNISHIAVYPNPTNGELNVSFSIQNDEKTTISIQDVSGKIIQAHLINAINGENVVSIDTQKMGAGIYFMQISVNGTVKIKKFIVE